MEAAVSAAAAAAPEVVEGLAEQRARLQEESHLLANETLPQLTADKAGTLEVAVQGVRNVGPEAEEVESAVGADEPVPELRFLVEVVPGTVIEPAVEVEATEEEEEQEQEGGEEQVEVKLGGVASFRVASLEAKVVVHFGPRLEHYVRVPLHNKYKESELQQLSGWHASSVGEETETPEVRDVTGAPQVQLGFKFTRRNKEEILRATEQLRELQERIAGIHDQEREQRRPAPSSPPKSILKSSNGSGSGSAWENERRGASIRAVDEDEDDEDDEGYAAGYGPRALSLWRWIVTPVVIIIRLGRAAGALVWHRRAIFLFVGGTLFFHFRGDDLAV